MKLSPFPETSQRLEFEDLHVGDAVHFQATITAEDVATYAALTHDRNPLHLSGSAAQAAGFPDCIVHGMLTAALGPSVGGMLLPGERALLLAQEAKFLRPVPVGVTLGVSATVKHLSPAVRTVQLHVVATLGDEIAMRQTVTLLVRQPAI